MLQIFQFQNTGPAATPIVPSFTIGYVNDEVLAGGNAYISKGTDIFATSTNWILAARHEISFHIFPRNAAGGTLEVELSIDGITFDSYHYYPLPGLQLCFVTEQPLPGYIARFRLWNRDAGNPQLFEGNIQQRAK